MFAFISLGGKVDDSINRRGCGPYVFRLHGQTYHSMGSLLSKEGDSLKFVQLFFYDTKKEIEHRARALSNSSSSSCPSNPKHHIDRNIIREVKDVLDTSSDLVKTFRRARDRYNEDAEQNIRIKLVESDKDNRTYNLPTTIINSVETGKGGVYFVYGYKGTRKAFLWKTLAGDIRRRGDIVLNVSSSGIASLLMSGANGSFHIPYSYQRGRDFSLLHKQVLPVIPKGLRQDIVSASLKQSYLWYHCTVLKLTANMRLTVGARPEDVTEIREFAEWILKVGDGELGKPNDREVSIDVQTKIVVDPSDDSVTSIIDFTYPNILNNINDPSYFQEKTILDLTNCNTSKLGHSRI
nr:ATP-dependent DNA helicase pfh1-like [Tanacetum cinerariifolium]